MSRWRCFQVSCQGQSRWNSIVRVTDDERVVPAAAGDPRIRVRTAAPRHGRGDACRPGRCRGTDGRRRRRRSEGRRRRRPGDGRGRRRVGRRRRRVGGRRLGSQRGHGRPWTRQASPDPGNPVGPVRAGRQWFHAHVGEGVPCAHAGVDGRVCASGCLAQAGRLAELRDRGSPGRSPPRPPGRVTPGTGYHARPEV